MLSNFIEKDQATTLADDFNILGAIVTTTSFGGLLVLKLNEVFNFDAHAAQITNGSPTVMIKALAFTGMSACFVGSVLKIRELNAKSALASPAPNNE